MMSYLIYGTNLLIKIAIIVAIPYIILLITLVLIHDIQWLKGRHFFAREYLFIVYLISLAEILGFFSEGWNFGKDISYNIIPFSQESLTLMTLNLVAFIPLGIFLPLSFGKFRSFKFTAFFGLTLSFLVELTQMFFLGRLGDIDDIIFNTIGCCCGYGLYCLFSMLITKYKKSKIGYGTLAMVFAIFALLWGYSYKGVPNGYLLFLMFGLNIKSYAALKVIESVSAVLGIAAIAIGIKRKDDFLAKSGTVLGVLAVVLMVFYLLTMI